LARKARKKSSQLRKWQSQIKEYSPTQLTRAGQLFDYLYIAPENITAADVIIGFGQFDMKTLRP